MKFNIQVYVCMGLVVQSVKLNYNVAFRGLGSNMKLGGHYIIRAPYSLRKGIFLIVLSGQKEHFGEKFGGGGTCPQ